MRFRCSNKRQLVIMSAYQVSQPPKGLGTETWYMQQWRKLRAKQSEDCPRIQFWKNLTIFILAGNWEGTTETIVMLDTNADHANVHFAQMLIDCELSDLHNDLPLDIAPATYFRGTRQIDYILGSHSLYKLPIEQGYWHFMTV
jgi:hypothetical protein